MRFGGDGWDFSCTTCGNAEHVRRCVAACPVCGLAGFNMIHSGPVVEMIGIELPRRLLNTSLTPQGSASEPAGGEPT